MIGSCRRILANQSSLNRVITVALLNLLLLQSYILSPPSASAQQSQIFSFLVNFRTRLRVGREDRRHRRMWKPPVQGKVSLTLIQRQIGQIGQLFDIVPHTGDRMTFGKYTSIKSKDWFQQIKEPHPKVVCVISTSGDDVTSLWAPGRKGQTQQIH